MKRFFAAAAAIAALITASAAQATILQYTISGYDTQADGQREYASFQIDSDRMVDGYADGIGFYFAAVAGTFTYGDTTTTDPQDISFYLDLAHGYDDPTTNPGGLYVGGGELLGFNGPQLFIGSIDHPTLLTGDFTLIDDFSGSAISLTVTAAPEPATWFLMAGGVGLIGLALRRRPTAAAAVSM